jgi:hypothetical protein
MGSCACEAVSSICYGIAYQTYPDFVLLVLRSEEDSAVMEIALAGSHPDRGIADLCLWGTMSSECRHIDHPWLQALLRLWYNLASASGVAAVRCFVAQSSSCSAEASKPQDLFSSASCPDGPKDLSSHTHLPPAHCLALLCVQCSSAGLGFQELNKTICLFYGYLRKPAVAVESVEYVSLGDLLGRKIAWHGVRCALCCSQNVNLPIKRREPMGNWSHWPSVTNFLS